MNLTQKILETLVQFGVMLAFIIPISLAARWWQGRKAKAFEAKMETLRLRAQEGSVEETHHKRRARTDERMRLLDPNHDSVVKVERYAHTLSCKLVLGKASFIYIRLAADVAMRGQELVTNIADSQMVVFAALLVANVNCLLGHPVDASIFFRDGMKFDMPTTSPANAFTLIGWYNGKIPEGGKEGEEYTLSATIAGPAEIVAEGPISFGGAAEGMPLGMPPGEPEGDGGVEKVAVN